ncbi:hypothetical protein EVAR_74810_1 [Eumeta japonica]|uniref:Uncharacterized protein n=1 Tax=Eumeta variegata TaxID=151549 RepID=A0A4C1SSM5_EUMVA|nr:hypothetical protein EVAR_74810_1 [Eumeta japonica]
MGYNAIDKAATVADFCESKTESLSNWVHRVKSKSNKVKTKKQRDLRIIAMLTCSLTRAENELINKQRERARRWAQMRLDLGLRNTEEETMKQQKEKINNLWSCELSSLDNFFKNLDIPLRFAWVCTCGRHLGCRHERGLCKLRNGGVSPRPQDAHVQTHILRRRSFEVIPSREAVDRPARNSPAILTPKDPSFSSKTSAGHLTPEEYYAQIQFWKLERKRLQKSHPRRTVGCVHQRLCLLDYRKSSIISPKMPPVVLTKGPDGYAETRRMVHMRPSCSFYAKTARPCCREAVSHLTQNAAVNLCSDMGWLSSPKRHRQVTLYPENVRKAKDVYSDYSDLTFTKYLHIYLVGTRVIYRLSANGGFVTCAVCHSVIPPQSPCPKALAVFTPVIRLAVPGSSRSASEVTLNRKPLLATIGSPHAQDTAGSPHAQDTAGSPHAQDTAGIQLTKDITDSFHAQNIVGSSRARDTAGATLRPESGSLHVETVPTVPVPAPPPAVSPLETSAVFAPETLPVQVSRPRHRRPSSRRYNAGSPRIQYITGSTYAKTVTNSLQSLRSRRLFPPPRPPVQSPHQRRCRWIPHARDTVGAASAFETSLMQSETPPSPRARDAGSAVPALETPSVQSPRSRCRRCSPRVRDAPGAVPALETPSVQSLHLRLRRCSSLAQDTVGAVSACETSPMQSSHPRRRRCSSRAQDAGSAIPALKTPSVQSPGFASAVPASETPPVQFPASETPPVQSPRSRHRRWQSPRPRHRQCSPRALDTVGATPASETPPVQSPRPRHRRCSPRDRGIIGAVPAPEASPVPSLRPRRRCSFRARHTAGAVPATEASSVQSPLPRLRQCSPRVRGIIGAVPAPEASPVPSLRPRRRCSFRARHTVGAVPAPETLSVQSPRPRHRWCSPRARDTVGAVPVPDTPPVQSPRPRHRRCSPRARDNVGAVPVPDTPPVQFPCPRRRQCSPRARNTAGAVPATEASSVQSPLPRLRQCSPRARGIASVVPASETPAVQSSRPRHRRCSSRVRDTAGGSPRARGIASAVPAPKASPVQSPRPRHPRCSPRHRGIVGAVPAPEASPVPSLRPRRRCSSRARHAAGAVTVSETPAVQSTRPKHRRCSPRDRGFLGAVTASEASPVQSPRPRLRRCSPRVRGFAGAVPASETSPV